LELGGFGKEVLQTVLDCKNESKMFDVVGFIDENEKLWGKTICDLKVLGGLE
jgi:FlaA1/EpsC-like NDP-sugar epimerase